MKLLTIVCAEKIEDEIVIIFSDQKITNYTVLSNVGGCGVTGQVTGSGGWTDRNKMFFVILDDQPMTHLLRAIQDHHLRLSQEHPGKEVPLKVILQSCETIV